MPQGEVQVTFPNREVAEAAYEILMKHSYEKFGRYMADEAAQPIRKALAKTSQREGGE